MILAEKLFKFDSSSNIFFFIVCKFTIVILLILRWLIVEKVSAFTFLIFLMCVRSHQQKKKTFWFQPENYWRHFKFHVHWQNRKKGVPVVQVKVSITILHQMFIVCLMGWTKLNYHCRWFLFMLSREINRTLAYIYLFIFLLLFISI